ncbi:MAG: FAD-dependent oxidoreductase [Synergistaceae bacterium]|nr:FAD-dependent oxidoreductase [Synergistaceae bacterium]
MRRRISAGFIAFFTCSIILLFSAAASADTYDVVGTGKNGDVHVSVTIEAGKIVGIELREHQETPGIYEAAAEKIPQSIIANQSINVDAVSGATMTSDAIKEAVAKAITLAGLNVDDYRKAVAKAGEGIVKEDSAKVVVVGGGAAGMMAAIKLARNGVDVLVIEKGATIGVANGWNCGGPMASNTSVQKAEGVTITDEMLFNDLTEDAYLTSDSRLLRRVLARTGEAVELQLSTGLVMFLRPDNYGAGYRSRHGYKTAKADRPAFIKDAYLNAGGRLMCETAGESLILENGNVTGIRAKKSDGSILNIKADAVLLATGGYLGNNSIIKKHWGDINVNPLGNTLSTGDGIMMAEKAGGMLEESSFAMISNEFGGSNKKGGGWQRSNGAMTIGIYGGLLVDPNGERFFNEYYMANQPLSVGGEAVLRAGKFYAVVDQAFVDAVSTVGLFEYLGNPEDWYVGTMTAKGVVLKTLQADLDKAVVQGWAVKADTIEECAKFFGMSKLAETVRAYNSYCEAGKDEEYFKNPTFLKPVSKAPFYVVEYEPSAWGTLGGVRTDSSLRVLRSDLKPIKGLYAAGVDAGSLYCQPYYQVEGTAVGLAFGSGIYAADVIMADLAK